MSTLVSSGADPLVLETVDRLLGDICTHDAIEHAEVTGWSEPAWSALAEAGFFRLYTPRALGVTSTAEQIAKHHGGKGRIFVRLVPSCNFT